MCVTHQEKHNRLISPKKTKTQREKEREMATTTTEATKTSSTNGEDQKQSQNLRHQEVGHKSLLQSNDLYQVCFFVLLKNSAFQFNFSNLNLN